MQVCNLDLGAHLDARLGFLKIGPRKQGKGQVDCRGIQCVDRIVQVDAVILSDMQGPGFAHQAFGQIVPSPPIPVFVGIGESRFGNRFYETMMIKGVGLGVAAGYDIAQTVHGGHLGEKHESELLAAFEMTDKKPVLDPLYNGVERLAANQI